VRWIIEQIHWHLWVLGPRLSAGDWIHIHHQPKRKKVFLFFLRSKKRKSTLQNDVVLGLRRQKVFVGQPVGVSRPTRRGPLAEHCTHSARSLFFSPLFFLSQAKHYTCCYCWLEPRKYYHPKKKKKKKKNVGQKVSGVGWNEISNAGAQKN